MPFKFTGEPPPLGSTQGAFNSFAAGAPSPTPSSTQPSFASFGSLTATTSSFGTSPRANTLQHGNSSQSSLHPQISNKTDADATSLRLAESKDPLSQALHRADTRRPAVFGNAAVAADNILLVYLKEVAGPGQDARDFDRDAIHKLAGDLETLADTNPGTMRFLRCVFDQATTLKEQDQTRDKKPKQRPVSKIAEELSPSEYDDWLLGPAGPQEPQASDSRCVVQRNEDGKIDGITDFYSGRGSLDAMTTKFHSELVRRHWVGDHDNRVAGEFAYRFWYDRSDRVTLLADVQHWGFGPSRVSSVPPQEHEDFVDKLYEIVQDLDADFRLGWKVEGKEDASYFGGQQAAKSLVSTERRLRNAREGCSCPTPRTKETTYRAEYLDQPFRFMDLPPELRNRCYKFALLPEEVALKTCDHHLPQGIGPTLTPGLLSTSRLLKKETEGLLEDNTLIINLFIGGGTRQVVHRKQLSPQLGPKITSLVFIIDAARTSHPEVQSMDWRQLQTLTALRTLRITAVHRPTHIRAFRDWILALTKIITRVPASCTIDYGVETDLERQHVKEMLESSEQVIVESGDAEEVDVETLKEAAANIPDTVIQGSKSGTVSTYWRTELD